MRGLNIKDAAGYIRRGDMVVIAALLALSLLLFALSLLPQEHADCAVITVDGRRVAELPLDKDTVYTVSEGGHTNVIEVSDGRVRMREASCPDEICTEQGWISSGGETIVCLPNRVTVTLEGRESDDAPDAVAY